MRSLLFFVFAGGLVGSAYANPQIDLSNHNFDKGGYSLAVEWEFYWGQLLTPKDLSKAFPSERIHVPQSWQQLGHPDLGVATYRLKILLPANEMGLALFFPIINASAKIWVNGELVKETGRVNTDPSVYRAQLQSTYVPLPERIASAEIIVQVANFSYYHSGIAGHPQVDKASAIFQKQNQANGIENFFAGSLIALFIYQFILYFLYDRGKPYLWLALICLGVALRSMIVHGGSFLLPNLFPAVSWEVWKKLEFGSVYAISALFPLYVYHLFPLFAPRKLIWIFVMVAAILFCTVLVTPQYVYGRVLDICHLMLVLGFIYAVYGISRAWKAGSEDARIILFGVLTSFPFILMEILKNSRLLPLEFQFMYLVEIGVLVFLMFQVFLLARHYATSYRHVEVMNANLEKIVEERTGQLVTANNVKDRLLSVMSHDIKSPLNSLRSVLQLYNQGSMKREEFDDFAQLLESDLNKTNLLVDTILFWTANQLKGVQIKIESFDLAKLVEQNIQLFQTLTLHKKLTIRKETPSPLIVHSDKNVLHLVVRNLLSNAIKFSHEGGVIHIHVSKENSVIQLKVQDEGIGMDEDSIEKLSTPGQTLSKEGTHSEKGTGMGLSLCRDFLKEIKGEFIIKSELGKGSTFEIKLPVSLPLPSEQTT